MTLNCECCQKQEATCECLGPRSLACDFCGKAFQRDETFYESRAFRVLEGGGTDECSEDSAVLACERCEVIRMRAVRRLGWIPFLFRGGPS
jgi:hypothetical protein